MRDWELSVNAKISSQQMQALRDFDDLLTNAAAATDRTDSLASPAKPKPTDSVQPPSSITADMHSGSVLERVLSAPAPAPAPAPSALAAVTVSAQAGATDSTGSIISGLSHSALSGPRETAHKPYLTYYKTVKYYAKVFTKLIDGLDAIAGRVNELDALYNRVSATTTEVRHECQLLLKQQKSVLEAATHLRSHLSFFDAAEQISTHLKIGLRAANDLSDSALVSEEFSQLLNKLERSMAFVNDNVSPYSYSYSIHSEYGKESDAT